MSIQHFPADGRKTINWASGTSTEIFIYPADGSFADRNFLFRISTATVEAEESTFTFFEGITRHLMILKGELELIHEGRYTRHLKPFDQDTFSGEWSTRSKGRVTDFNLMLKAGATGSLTHHHLEKGRNWPVAADADYFFIFLAAGNATLPEGAGLQPGDMIQIDRDAAINITAADACDLVVISVRLEGNRQ